MRCYYKQSFKHEGFYVIVKKIPCSYTPFNIPFPEAREGRVRGVSWPPLIKFGSLGQKLNLSFASIGPLPLYCINNQYILRVGVKKSTYHVTWQNLIVDPDPLSGAVPRRGEGGPCPHLRLGPPLVPHLGSTEKLKIGINFLYNYNSYCFQGLAQSKAAHLTVLPVNTTSAIAWYIAF